MTGRANALGEVLLTKVIRRFVSLFPFVITSYFVMTLASNDFTTARRKDRDPRL